MLRQKDFPTWCPWRAPIPLRNHLSYSELFHYFQKAFMQKKVCHSFFWNNLRNMKVFF